MIRALIARTCCRERIAGTWNDDHGASSCGRHCPPCRGAVRDAVRAAVRALSGAGALVVCAASASRPESADFGRANSSREGAVMEIRVLGPVEVLVDGARPRRCPAAGERELLGAAGPVRRPRGRRAGPDRRAVGRGAAGQSGQRPAGAGVQAAPRPDRARPAAVLAHDRAARVPARRRLRRPSTRCASPHWSRRARAVPPAIRAGDGGRRYREALALWRGAPLAEFAETHGGPSRRPPG